jgi:hypothetical protein
VKKSDKVCHINWTLCWPRVASRLCSNVWGAQTKQNHIMLPVRVDFSMFQLDDLSWLIFVQKGWDHESLFRLCLHASNVLSYLASIWLVIANAERVRPFIVVPPSWKTCQIPTKMIPN